MAPIVLNKNGSQQTKPVPKTSPSTDTAPPRGKYGHHQLSTIKKSVSKKDALTYTGREIAHSQCHAKKEMDSASNSQAFQHNQGLQRQYNISCWKGQERDWRTHVGNGDINGTARRI